MPTKIRVAEPGPIAEKISVELRGTTYTFTEIPISEYDKLLKQATRDDVDKDGNEVEITDNTLLMRLMILKSCIEPKLTADEVAGLGTRLYRQMARIVNELHYGEEPVKQTSADEVDDLDAKAETTEGKT